MLLPMLSMAQTQIGADIDGEAANDESGRSVSLSGDGTTLAIGAPQNDGSATNAGSVRVYKNVSGIWSQIGADIDGEAAYDANGVSVSLSGDGTILAVGATLNAANGPDSGSVRVYKYVSDTWIQIGADIDGEARTNRSGYSVSLSRDGGSVAIGAPFNGGNGYSSGSVRVYKNISGTWIQVGNDIDGEAEDDESGRSVSISADGTVVAIGAPDNDGRGFFAGSVRVYKNVFGVWTQIGADIDGEAESDESGTSISLSDDGSVLAIGSLFNDGSGLSAAGSVRVYKNVLGSWTQIGADIDGEEVGECFGVRVSLSSDGSILAVGAHQFYTGLTNAGLVRIYKNVSDTWIQIGATIYGEAIGDNSGDSISLSGDGKRIAIGAPYNDDNGEYSGSVRVYDLSGILSSDIFVLTNFSLYPNPASEFVTINLKEGLLLEKVTIYNAAGQIVKTEKNNVININSLQKGSYFFEVITNKGKATRTILVQ